MLQCVCSGTQVKVQPAMGWVIMLLHCRACWTQPICRGVGDMMLLHCKACWTQPQHCLATMLARASYCSAKPPVTMLKHHTSARPNHLWPCCCHDTKPADSACDSACDTKLADSACDSACDTKPADSATIPSKHALNFCRFCVLPSGA